MNPSPEDARGTPALATEVTEISRRFDERIVTATLPVYRESNVLFDTLEQAARTGRATLAGERHASTYGTAGTPTTYALMDALASIEGRGHACRAALMPSGLSAISTALLAYVKTGDHVLMSDSVYGPARNFAQGMLTGLGVETTFFDPSIGATQIRRSRSNATTFVRGATAGKSPSPSSTGVPPATAIDQTCTFGCTGSPAGSGARFPSAGQLELCAPPRT